MAIHWHWAFGSETPAELLANADFSFGTIAGYVESATDPYTYAGSPAKWSMRSTASGNLMTYPAVASPGPIGAVSIAIRNSAGNWNTASNLLEVESTDGVRLNSVYVRASVGSVSLYVDNIFKVTTAVYDWSSWRYLTLKYDMSGAVWSGQIFIDGVAATALLTDAAAAIASTVLHTGGAHTTSSTYVGQIIVHDNIVDPSEVPRFVTRIPPNADGVNIGVWVPFSGGTDFAELAPPIDPASYTEEAAPIVLDRVEVLTNGAGSDINTALGAVAGVVDSVAVHSFSSGQTITARAIVGDGVAETPGTTATVNATTTYLPAVANTKPSGGAWTGTDAPNFVYEVVSI